MHPEADAFLDAIFDNSDDDTVRLVYADWLEENGQEDYARFLRLSVLGQCGSVPAAELRRIQSERKHLWKRIKAVRYDALVGVQIHDYTRGILNYFMTYGDKLVRTIDAWWPAMTPYALTMYGMRGFGSRSIESEVTKALSDHLPWLRDLRCLSSTDGRIGAPEGAGDPPLDGSLFAVLTRPGVLPRLQTLQVTITRADAPALRAFAESELASRLQRLYLNLRRTEISGDGHITIYEKQKPDTIRLAIKGYLAENRM